MRALRLALVMVAMLASAGCVHTPRPIEREQEPADVVDVGAVEEPKPEPPVTVTVPVLVPAPTVDEASLALAYFERVRRMPAAELGRELEAKRALYTRTQSDADRMRVAMLLGLPGTPVSDDARALELLDPMVKNPGHALHALAVLLATYVQEQRRLTQSAQALQKDVHTLQQKLDALRSLERALSEREGAGPRRR